MIRKSTRSTCAAFIVSFAVAIAAQTTDRAAPPADLDAWVARAMKTFEVPGVALAIVTNTKAFTATALALLVEEKKVEWDAPVIRYLPGFAMWGPYVTRELTVRDLLVHRSGLGLGAGDLLWWPASAYDRKEIARRV